MTTWKVDGESLLGRIELPMAVGTVAVLPNFIL